MRVKNRQPLTSAAVNRFIVQQWRAGGRLHSIHLELLWRGTHLTHAQIMAVIRAYLDAHGEPEKRGRKPRPDRTALVLAVLQGLTALTFVFWMTWALWR
jgi:hypothetical protein